MARTPTVWLRQQTGWYYTTLNGKKVRLARDKKEADRAFHALMAQTEPEPAPAARMTFRRLADLYLGYTKAAKSEKTFVHQLHFLKGFATRVKGKAVADLKVGDVTGWILANAGNWGHNSQVTARGVLRACLRWGVEQGHIPADPLARMTTGSFHRTERMLTREERERIKAAVTYAPFRNLLSFLELTGCRPFSEATTLTADMIDWQAETITFEKHKNARKGKRRVVYLAPALQAMLREWCAATPEGPLFVTKNGKPYNRSNVVQRVRYLERSLKLPRWSLYSFRHAYFTEALEKGVPAEVLAELGGNSARTLVKYYSHLDQRKDALKAAAARAVS